MPAATTCWTTPAVALERMQAVVREGTRRCRWVTAADACGRDPVCWAGVAAWGRWSVADVPPDPSGGLAHPATVVPEGVGRGRQPTPPRLAAGAPTAQTVAVSAAPLRPGAGPPHLSQAGSPGPLWADLAGLRVGAGRDRWPGPDVWLILRRPPESGALNTSRAAAPVDTPGETWARSSGRRWPMEPGCEDRQQWLGRGDDAVRRWTGWHQHLPWVRLAHFGGGRTRLHMKKTPRP